MPCTWQSDDSFAVTTTAFVCTSQHSPGEVEMEARHFVLSVVPMLARPMHHQDFFLNMDQMNMFFSTVPTMTLQQRGSRTINIWTAIGATTRCTIAITISVLCFLLRLSTKATMVAASSASLHDSTKDRNMPSRTKLDGWSCLA
jgi:hypothetical protein